MIIFQGHVFDLKSDITSQKLVWTSNETTSLNEAQNLIDFLNNMQEKGIRENNTGLVVYADDQYASQ